MRILCFVLAALMVLFVAVQYNDPDGPKWMVIYGIPAILALLAGLRPEWYRSFALLGLLLAGIVAAIAGTVYYWPTSDNWWTKEVWWEVETAREGMGMMITVVVLGLIFLAQRSLNKKN
ncbi:MAG: transmembrane 220 family protein [Granulosicoccaceae bacterium]